MIAVYSAATVCSPADVEKMVHACATQVERDFAPAWSRLPSTPRFFSDKSQIPAGAPTILVADVCDDPEALAYHTEGTDGSISGLVGAKTILEDSGALFSGSVSVSGALSHEILETHVDPFVDFWVAMPDGQHLVAFEVCDPVQERYYVIGDVAVSSFVYPAWFNARAKAPQQFDATLALDAPFTRTAGGYYVVQRAGKISQIGASRPRWKPKASLARTMRRAARVAVLEVA